MTTLLPGHPGADQTPSDLPRLAAGPLGTSRDSRLRRWWASWRVALRMARRDVRRHRGRSLLVLVMVAVPTALLTGLTGFAASSSMSAAERVPLTLGTAQALLTGPEPHPVVQGANPDEAITTKTPEDPASARRIPGLDPAKGLAAPANLTALEALVRGDVEPVASLDARRVVGDRTKLVSTLALDPSRGLGEKAELASGRWAKGAGEVVVTPYGLSRGLPRSGTVELRVAGKAVTVSVVGVASVFDSWAAMPELVSAEPLAEADYVWQWLVFRPAPVTYDEVRQLNDYGLRVHSAHVLQHPPTTEQLPAELRSWATSSDENVRALVAVGGVMLFLVTTLLVAPAFAVGAARQRRTLALAASNGAETRQLRRTVGAQALLLGAVSAVAAAALALVALWLGTAWWVAQRPWTSHRHVDVPVGAVALIVGVAVVSAVTAALVPAARLARIDIVGVMRGQSVSPRLNRVAPALGLVLAVGGGTALVWAVRTQQHELPVAAAAIALVLGALMLVPLLLVGAGHLARPLPVALRMATRDAARHRTRSVPTVAAVMAGAAALTVFGVALASDTEQQRREYHPQAPMGEGWVSFVPAPQDGSAPQGPPTTAAAEALVRRVTPGLVSYPLGRLAHSGFGLTETDPVPVVAVVPPGCTAEASFVTEPPSEGGGTAPGVAEDPATSCARLSSTGPSSIGTLAATDLDVVAALSPGDRALLRAGGMLVHDRTLVSDGRLTVAATSATYDGDRPRLTRVTTAEVPARVTDAFDDVRGMITVRALVTTETAAARGWPVSSDLLVVRDPAGPVSEADEAALVAGVGDEGGVYVERGFQRDDAVVMAVLYGGFGLLLLVVTLISTALSLAEQRSDLATLAAVGATRGTRRRMAAAQAAVVAVAGTCVGTAVGIVPGIAMTYPLTTRTWDPLTGLERVVPPTVVVPWLPLAAVLVGVPLVAALLSAVAVRRPPTVTRRAD